MNQNKIFTPTITIVCILGFLLTVLMLWLYKQLDNLINIYSVLASFIAVITNFAVGIYVIKISFRKGNKQFLLQFFGSMMIRLIFTLIFVVIGAALIKFPLNPFIFSFFGFYLFSLIFEISFLARFTKNNIT